MSAGPRNTFSIAHNRHRLSVRTACIRAPFCAELSTTATADETTASGFVRLTSCDVPKVSGAFRLSAAADMMVRGARGEVSYGVVCGRVCGLFVWSGRGRARVT